MTKKTIYTVKVTSYSLHVRSQPNASSSAVAWIQKDQTFTASKVSNGWYYIDSKKGWSSGNYLQVVKTETIGGDENKATQTAPTKVETKGDTTVTKTATETKKETPKPTTKTTLDTNTSTDKNLISYDNTINPVEVSRDVNVPIKVLYKARNITYGMGAYPHGRMDTLSGGYADWNEHPGNHDYKTSLSGHFEGMEHALSKVRESMNIFEEHDRSRLFNEFNRFKIAMPSYNSHKVFPYIFFTRPEVDIVGPTNGQLKSEFARDPLYAYLYNNNPAILRSLNKSLDNSHMFNVFLSNAARSFEPSDEVIRTVEHGETYTGWKTVYARNTNESNTAGQFSVHYHDNHNYDVFKMHKAWLDYMNRAYRGAISVDRKKIHHKILDYACSVYYIVCAEDGETILYWCKYWGVFPINTPASASGYTAGAIPVMPDFSINYMYAMKEDYDPSIFVEFNLQSTANHKYRKTYNDSTATISNSLTGAPFVEHRRENGRITHKLRFRD